MKNKYKLEVVNRIRKKIPLETRIKLSNRHAFHDLIHDLLKDLSTANEENYDDLIELHIIKAANKHTEKQMKVINNYYEQK